MKIQVAIALIMAAAPAKAVDLYCQGTAWPVNLTQAIEASRVLSLSSNGEMSISTFTGPAAGTVKQGTQLYTGFLRNSQATYWINLDRYSGEFILIQSKPDGTYIRMEFSGVCKRRTPKF